MIYNTLQSEVLWNLDKRLQNLNNLEAIRGITKDRITWDKPFTYPGDIISTDDINWASVYDGKMISNTYYKYYVKLIRIDQIGP